MEVRWWMKELQWWGVSENVVTISCSCSHVTLWNKSAWIITGNSACCKSYSIQEVLEAAQASQHFRSLFFFSPFQFLYFFISGFFLFFFCLFCLFALVCFLFFFGQSCVRASESLWNTFGDAYLILVPSCPPSVIPDGHLSAQPSPLAHSIEGQTCPFSHLLAVLLLQPVLVPWFHFPTCTMER